MSPLHDLSKFIVLPIYVEWMETKDLCRIDTATCNKTERDHFLNSVSNENIQYVGMLDNIASKDYLSWASNRGVRVTNLLLDVIYPVDKVRSFLPALTHLKSLSVKADSYKFRVSFVELLSIAPLLESIVLTAGSVLNDHVIKQIGKFCPNLKKLHFLCSRMSTWLKDDKSFIQL
jgi:hypothetical protein